MRQLRNYYSKGKKGERNISDSKGRISIVGIGPGNLDYLTPAAKDAIEDSEIVIGYKTYLEFVHDLIEDAEVLSSGMRREVDRCDKAVDLALEGNKVAVICSGDPGIYAMAGLVLEIAKGKGQSAEGQDKLLPIEVIPGVSALNASAARLGAPLMHDFASISMSDLLTPWELIEKRLEAAASADFVIAIYNPKSKGRQEHIGKARDIILKFRSPDTPVGIVRAATRDDEKIVITDLNRMLENEIDMQSTVIIGNSQTFTWEGRMITPRGYQEKYKLE
ncbi:MAG: precorrin-3B C(17)-methyltransferase [Nitrospirota bacterium]